MPKLLETDMPHVAIYRPKYCRVGYGLEQRANLKEIFHQVYGRNLLYDIEGWHPWGTNNQKYLHLFKTRSQLLRSELIPEV